MGGTTARYGFRYPALSDLPNVPLDIQNLATDVDAIGVIGGKTALNPSAQFTTVETIVVNTPTLNYAASSLFMLEFYMTFNVTVTGSDVVMKIRQTNTSGTIIGQVNALGVYLNNNYGVLRVPYVTTTAQLGYFVGTAVSTGVGTGLINAVAPTFLTVTLLGPSSMIGNY